MWGRIEAGRVAPGWLALACGLLLLALAPSPSPASASARARAAVVGGTPVVSITQAPWTAYILNTSGWACDGAILDATHVLTAGHCLYDDDFEPPLRGQLSDFRVYTGDASVAALFTPVLNLSALSFDTVIAAVADPSYDWSNTGSTPASQADAYDVGVLTLATPLSFSAGVQPISLGPAAGAPPSSAVSLAGFGAETPVLSPQDAVSDGSLNRLELTTAPAGECVPTVDALVGCASAAAGSACFGDSGSVLTSPGMPAIVLGVVDQVGMGPDGDAYCGAGAPMAFAKVTTPEIAAFINDTVDGEPGPYPPAPQGGADIQCSSVDQVGQTITCSPGTWTNAPVFTYEFIDDTTGAVLQTGSTSYTVTSAAAGDQIAFLVIATNAGGTADDRTVDTPTILPAPIVTATVATSTSQATVSPLTTSQVTTSSTRTTTTTTLTEAAKPPKPTLHLYASSGEVSPRGLLALRVVLDSGASTVTRARVCAAVPTGTTLTPASRGKPAARVCWTVSLRPGAERTLPFSVRVGPRARRGTLTATAVASITGLRQLTAVVRVVIG